MSADNSLEQSELIELIEVSQTKAWLEQIVIGLNFCPFAKKEFVNNTIHYHVSAHKSTKQALAELAEQLAYLHENDQLETSLVIYQQGFKNFEQFLDLVDYANDLVVELGYEGTFQLANFHPEYLFADEDFDSPSHFTNRAPYPTLHLIREASMEKVLNHYPDPESIPENNIALAEAKGSHYFEQILKQIKHS